ncbi:MAG TPA: type II secretion system protein N [Spongiibacteraceae bacterium]|nr:type II secretion system protein N [Spongiibacteraceae bacterium]
MSSFKNSLASFSAVNGGALLRTARRRRISVAAAAVWFFASLLWTAPASLMVAVLKPIAPQLELQIPEGGFWRGRAGAAFWQNNDQRIALGTVEWRLSPWSLLWLHPGAHITANYGQQFIDANVRLSPLGSVQLRDVRAALPVAALAHWLPMPADGLLGLKLARVEIARREPLVRELEGEASWQQAAWQWSSRWVALGDYSCQLDMKESARIHAVLQGQGALAANGEATVNFKDKDYSLQLLLSPTESLPQEFREGLGLFLGGQRDAQGHWQIKRSGKW